MPIPFLLVHSLPPSQEGHKSQCLGITISLMGNQPFPLLEGRLSPFRFWSTSRPLEEEMSLLFPFLTSPILRMMDPSDISGCTLLSLTPPPRSPNDHHAGVTPLPRALINAGHCHWPGLGEGNLSPHSRTTQLIAGLAAKGALQMLNTDFITLKLLCLKKHLPDGNIKASLQ